MMGVMSNFPFANIAPSTKFEGFCQYPRKWHILPTLSIDFRRNLQIISIKILTNSGYIMLDLVYFYIQINMILYLFVDISRKFQGFLNACRKGEILPT